jgi:putative SOS response-associated peptidase YedK
MCFTVAIIRNNTLQTVRNYYDSLPEPWRKEDNMPEFPDMYFKNGFSHPVLPVLKKDGLEMMRWGLIPSWVKSEDDARDISVRTLNARSESVFEKASFKKSMDTQRAILPVYGFFEWKDFNKQKYPYFIYHPENKGFAIGALYDRWVNPQSGEQVNTFSIVTTEANDLMAEIHNTKKRMPLILPPDEMDSWLRSDFDTRKISALMKPFPSDQMQAHTITRKANNLREDHDYQLILEKVSYPELEGSQQSLF